MEGDTQRKYGLRARKAAKSESVKDTAEENSSENASDVEQDLEKPGTSKATTKPSNAKSTSKKRKPGAKPKSVEKKKVTKAPAKVAKKQKNNIEMECKSSEETSNSDSDMNDLFFGDYEQSFSHESESDEDQNGFEVPLEKAGTSKETAAGGMKPKKKRKAKSKKTKKSAKAEPFFIIQRFSRPREIYPYEPRVVKNETLIISGYEGCDDKLVQIASLKTKLHPQSTKLVLDMANDYIEPILCIANSNLNLNTLKVKTGDEDRVEDLIKIHEHLPYLKRLSFEQIMIDDEHMATLFRSLNNLEFFTGNYVFLDHWGVPEAFDGVGPNLKCVKWVTNPWYGTGWINEIKSVAKGNRITWFSLDENEQTVSEKHNIAKFLSCQMPNLVSLRIMYSEIETLEGLDSLTHLRELYIEAYSVKPQLLLQPLMSVKKLVLVSSEGAMPELLSLFPSVDDVTLNYSNTRECFSVDARVIEILEKMNLESFTLIEHSVKLAKYKDFVKLVDALSSVPKLTFAFINGSKINAIFEKFIGYVKKKKEQMFEFVTSTKSSGLNSENNVSVKYAVDMEIEVKRLQRLTTGLDID